MSASHDLPPAVRDFLRTYVDSAEQLEILAHLFATPDRALTIDDITRELRLTASSVERRVGRLTAHGLLTAEGGPPLAYRFAPRDRDVRDVIPEVMRYYKERTSRVITFIFSGPVAEVMEFADAFKIKKDRRDG